MLINKQEDIENYINVNTHSRYVLQLFYGQLALEKGFAKAAEKISRVWQLEVMRLASYGINSLLFDGNNNFTPNIKG